MNRYAHAENQLAAHVKKLKNGLRHMGLEPCNQAADAIESLQLELKRSQSTITIISGALSHAERQASQHDSKAQALENENRRLKLDLVDARKALEALAAQGSGAPGSAAKADCMASIAGLALRSMDSARQQKG